MFRRAVLTFGLSLFCGLTTLASAAEKRKPITQPKYDPAAPRVDFFDGIDQQSIEAELRLKNEFGGNVFIRNLTDKPITVVLPDAAVGLHVHPQFNFLGNNNNQGNMAGGPGGGGAMGQNQGVGGTMGQNSTQGIGVGPGQNGFFSIPAAATVRLPFESVCLEHGKPVPTSRNVYRLVRTENYSDKPELKAIAHAIAERKTDRAAIQAAAWHITSGMTWEQLAAKKFDRAAAADTPYFSKSQLQAARHLVEQSVAQAKPASAETATTAAAPKPSERRSASPQ